MKRKWYLYKPLIFAFEFTIFWSVRSVPFLSHSCARLAKFCPLVVLELWGALYGTVRIAWLVSWFSLFPVSTKNCSPRSVSNMRNSFLTAASATVARMQSVRMLPLDWVKQPYLSTCIMVILCFKLCGSKHFSLLVLVYSHLSLTMQLIHIWTIKSETVRKGKSDFLL